jgi:hypothetical protein
MSLSNFTILHIKKIHIYMLGSCDLVKCCYILDRMETDES